MGKIEKGRVLNGKWTVGELLGSGATGAVYEASHRNQIRAAVKILDGELAADEDQVARFLREGAIANHVDHVGVVSALDDDRTEDGLVYVVFERVDGSSLAEIMTQQAPLSVAFALELTEKLLEVLTAAHEEGVLPRDIEPRNVFVLPSGGIKLLDFGRAKARELPTSERVDVSDERSDLHAVAALLFTMLTRKRPLDAGDGTKAPPIRSVQSSVPEVVAQIVDRGLSSDPAHRFQTATRMLGVVRLAVSTLQPADVGASCASAPRTTSLRAGIRGASVRVTIVVGLVGVAALVGLAWLASAAPFEQAPARAKSPAPAER